MYGSGASEPLLHAEAPSSSSSASAALPVAGDDASSRRGRYWAVGTVVVASAVVLLATHGPLAPLSSSAVTSVSALLNTARLSSTPIGTIASAPSTVAKTPVPATATATATAAAAATVVSSSTVATAGSSASTPAAAMTSSKSATTTPAVATTSSSISSSSSSSSSSKTTTASTTATTAAATVTPTVAAKTTETAAATTTAAAASAPSTSSSTAATAATTKTAVATPSSTTATATKTTVSTPSTTTSTTTTSNKPGAISQNTASSSKAATTATAASSSSSSSSTMASKKSSGSSKFPNIVFVLADDLGYSQIGIPKDDPSYFEFDLDWATPRLTQLATQGIVLKNYYSQEVCTPARASLLTGRYPLSIGMQYGVVDTRTPWGLNPAEQTLADVLSENGYVTKAFGKWHLGHHSPKFLPTARGFDSFVGYMNGDNYYYSKRNPLEFHFIDFLTMDRETYCPYTEDDLHLYSTHFYREKAIETIQNHDQSSPLFLYLPFQAVHDPFADFVQQRDNAKNFVSDDVRAMVRKNVVGAKREDYAYALSLLDGAVGAIHDTLVETGMMDNTYFIFASDNGGCYSAGGKNGPFRGTKGTIFEGGTKVDAFVYSPLLASSQQGTQFNGLMHVSDWFPTILEMTGVPYTPRSGYELDGVSQLQAWLTGVPARTEMLYNSVHNVKNKGFDMMTNGWFAVRNEQYKLAHYFNSAYYAQWYDPATQNADDEESNISECAATSSYAFDGDFTYALFDLVNDPYEKVNLYDDAKYASVKEELYALVDKYNSKSGEDVVKSIKASKKASVFWQQAGGYIVPYTNEDNVAYGMTSYGQTWPKLCKR